MRILDKYVLKEFIHPFLFGVAAFTAIFIGADLLFRMARLMTTYGASVSVVLKVFVLALPRIIVYTFPMSVLLGSLMAIARLSGSAELIVMRSAGQSFRRLALPIFILGLFISGATVLFNEFVVPAAMAEYEYTIDYEIKRNVRPQTRDHIVLKNVHDGKIQNLLYAKRYDADTELLYNLTIQQFEDEQLVRIQNADKAQWKNGNWTMFDGTMYDLSGSDGKEHILRFKEQVLPFNQTPEEVAKIHKEPDTMGIRELRREIQGYEAAYADTTELEMEIHRRFSLPLASFVFALLGAPLGIQKQRSSSSIGFGISVIVIFTYYALMTFSAALGEGGVLSPILAVWLPDLVALVFAVWLLKRVSK